MPASCSVLTSPATNKSEKATVDGHDDDREGKREDRIARRAPETDETRDEDDLFRDARLPSRSGHAEEHAETTGQQFDRNDPIPFFLHNVLGIDTGSGFKLRVPLAVLEDGSIGCASDIPAGATVHIMRTTAQSAADAAMRAVSSAMSDMRGTPPEVALFFDCVATRLRMGGEFGMEMDALQRALGSVPYVGCNTYGQIARSEGQFSGFHNCTATVALLPD